MPGLGKLLFPAVLLVLVTEAIAAGPFAEFYLQFKKGGYVQALEALERKQARSKKERAAKEYLTALTLSRLQRFDEAITHYTEAIKLQEDAEDLYYEFGQALYAANELERARVAFKKSYSLGFKTATSLYYMGFISQVLEEYGPSINYFNQILVDKKADERSTQVAMFQKAESILALEKSKNLRVKKLEREILPLFQAALDFNPHSQTAPDILGRMNEIQREFGLDPTKYRNGRLIAKDKFKAYVSQEIKYDDNVTNRNDQASVETTEQDSFIFTTKAHLRGNLEINRRFNIRPEMHLALVEHSDRDNPEVYSNDSLEYNPSLYTSLEHTFNGSPASLSFEVSFRHKEQDVNQNKEKVFHSRSWSYELGERLKLFDFGETGFKVKYKTYRSYSKALDNNIKSIAIDQLYITKRGHILLFLINYDDTDNFNDPAASTASTLLRSDWLIPEIIPTYTLHLALGLSLLDTKEQSDSRGTEVTYSPMIKLQKKLSDNLRMAADHTYTGNTSKSADREYTKSVTTLELRYSF